MSNKKLLMGLFTSLIAFTIFGCSKPKSETIASDTQSPESVKLKVKGVDASKSGSDVSVMVDKEPAVMKAEVDSMAEMIFNANAHMIPEDNVEMIKAQIRQSAIEQLTMQYLLDREAKKAGIEISDEERDAQFALISGGMSMENAAEESGMDVEKFAEFMKINFRIEKLLDSKIDNLPDITDEELKAHFDSVIEMNPEAGKSPETVSAAHILVMVDEDTPEDIAKIKIDDIYQQLEEGADFAELAEELSDCPSGQRAGGSLGMFGRGQMVKEFEDAAFSQEIGIIGKPFKSSFGYHIVRVDAKNEAGEVKFEDVKDNLKMGMLRERDNQIRSKFIMEVRENSQIENLEAPIFSETVMSMPDIVSEAVEIAEEAVETVEEAAEAAEEVVEAAVEEAAEIVEDVAEVAEEAEETVAEVIEVAVETVEEAAEEAEEEAAE
ncbi:MAG: hypothetical protein GX804_05140 [Lentisphaerae bacterium]|nr:hypothetical protein [Lentisphaerota bacterium]